MFLVNSRHPLVCAPGLGLPQDRALFSRSYEGNLPSSFSRVLSSAWVSSTSPPVSVSGTVKGGGYFLEGSSRRPNPIRTDNTSPPSPPAGWGLLTPFPSTTPFGLALGAGSPCADWPCAGTLGLSARGVLTLFIATHVSILTCHTSTDPRGVPLRRPRQRSATARLKANPQLRCTA